MKTTTRNLAATLAALGLLTLGACAGDDSGGSSGDSAVPSLAGELAQDTEATNPDEVGPPSTEPERAATEDGSGAREETGTPSTATVAEPDPDGRDVIRTGTVSLRSKDVARTRFDVQKTVDEVGGTIGDEQTTTNRDGEVDTTRLVLRVPAESFDKAMTALAEAAELVGTTRSGQDVSTEVIDVAARIRAQEKSLTRIEALLAEADDLSELVRIEAELTNRQATLDSLKSRQAWLADQTSMSTITVHVEHDDEAPVEEPSTEEQNPFLAGLFAGWDALSSVGAGLAGVAGALLPFAAVALLLGLGVRLGWRRVRRAGRPARTPSAA